MQRIKTYIGFAVRSNHIIKGLDDISRSRKKIYLIISTSNLQQNSKDKLNKLSNEKGIKTLNVDESLLNELNINGVKVLGITDANLSNAILKIMNN